MKSKAITYERIMDAIFAELGNEELSENAIENYENARKLNAYIKKYTEPVFKTNSDLYSDMYCELIDIICEYCRSGFYAGFEAAVTLLGVRGGSEL